MLWFSHLPYCGLPATPQSLWGRWNLDPWMIGALVAALLVYGAWARSRPVPALRQGAAVAGWAVFAALLVSPICALSVALFSVRVFEHMALTVIAAPLIALGLPGGPGLARSATLAAGMFAAALWTWHAPGPYAFSFHGAGPFWLMELSLGLTALWLAAALIAARHEPGRLLAAGAATTGQMGLLGALITFAPQPLYPVHALTTQVFGLTPLDDQALGGAVMWVPAGVALAALFALGLRTLLRRPRPRSWA